MLRWITLFCATIVFHGHAQVLVEHATLRLLPPGVPNTAAYFELHNTGEQSEVIVSAAVSPEIAQSAEIHSHIMDGESMRMEHVDELSVAPGETIKFMPGGLHLMVFGLQKPLSEGQIVQFELTTKADQKIVFDAKVSRP